MLVSPALSGPPLERVEALLLSLSARKEYNRQQYRPSNNRKHQRKHNRHHNSQTNRKHHTQQDKTLFVNCSITVTAEGSQQTLSLIRRGFFFSIPWSTLSIGATLWLMLCHGWLSWIVVHAPR